jgi:leucine dehydrogenase
MQAAGVSRGYIITNANGQPVASHSVLEPIASFLATDKIDYDKHEAIFFGVSPRTGELMSAFLWKTKRGQGCGGIRLRTYNSVEEYIRDGLRLAIGMGRKSSLAGLYWGGGKGIIPSDSNMANPRRKELLEDYGEFLSSLRGCYVAAEDVGITVDDVDVVVSCVNYRPSGFYSSICCPFCHQHFNASQYFGALLFAMLRCTVL